MTETRGKGKVLAVDADFLSRRFVERVLARAGYQIISMVSVAQAKEELKRNGSADLACIITDFGTAQNDGLDLLTWIVGRDPCVSAIVMSYSSDQTLFERMLRSGACNFLTKPLDRRTVERAIEEAVQLTRGKRRTLAMQKDVEQVGIVQRLLINSNVGRDSSDVKLCIHPKHEAGGDFFSFYDLSGSKSVAMMTDVSGHDLKSAFVAAYFQGLVRAMLDAGTNLHEIFERSNQLLLNESTSDPDGLPISISACAVSVDQKWKKLEALTCGAPPPIFTSAGGVCRTLRNGTSHPLGWFFHTEVDSTVIPLEPGQITMWTDGVEELADTLNTSPAAIAFALVRAQQGHFEVPCMRQANDDILVSILRIEGPDAVGDGGLFYPLLNEIYHAEQLSEIDTLQLRWKNSMSVAMPDMPDCLLHDVLLCAREGMINSLKHGCAEGGEASIQLTVGPRQGTLKLVIEDDGPGHDFNSDAHEEVAAEHLDTRHRGLILMKALSNNFTPERRGAKITLDFVAQDFLGKDI